MSKWTEEVVARVVDVVGEDLSVEVSLKTVDELAETLGEEFTDKSVAAKLRNMGYAVEKVGKKAPEFSPDQEAELREFVTSNAGLYTYGEIAAALFDGQKSSRQIQGKLLSMELNENVKPTEKKEVAKTFTDEEEETFIKLANSGAYIEDIATTLGKEVNPIRGKALSLLRAGQISSIPKLRESHANVLEDPLEAIGDLSEFTVAEIADKIEKTERGIKTMLTRRGLKAKDYDGVAKKAKAEAAKLEAA